MTRPARLASSVLATSLIRLAEAQGGFGMVLAKGDETAGSIALILLEKGRNPRFFERTVEPGGTYSWQPAATPVDSEESLRSLVERRRRADPDLWIIELDVASPERFAAEMNAIS